MLDLLRKATPVIEERGPGWFAPARPRPHPKRLGAISGILHARYSLVSFWEAGLYRSLHGSTRLFGRQIVLANSPESVKYIMATAHANYERKSPLLRRALEYLVGDGLFLSDGETWKRRRPLVVDIMHKSRMNSFAPTMEGSAAETVAKWENRTPGEVFDVMADMGELTAEIITRAVFGNNLGPEAVENVVQGFNSYMRASDSVNLAYFFGWDEGKPIRRTKKLNEAIARVHGVIEKVVNDHLAGDSDDASMVELLIRRQKKNPELGLVVSALRNEASTIFMAGQETTATTLTWAFYLLANAPWIEEAVVAEIEHVCGSRPPTIADINELDWCKAVIDETLRLYPPVPVLSRQARNADSFLGIDVDPAALVIVVPWLLHRAEDLWDRPTHFRPERFLDGQRPTPYSYVPFAAGPRICAGLSFGLTESVLCLATLLQRFKVRPVATHKVEPVCRLTLRPLGGMPVTVEPRG
jgi:cytochrome P450